MAQPVAYAPVTSFVSYQATQPWFPGQNIDVELNSLKTTTDQLRANLALIQRDDGALLQSTLSLATAGLKPVISASDYNAVGDGVANDTAALARAFSAAKGKILLLTGTYLTDPFSINSSNCPLQIVSLSATIKQRSGSGPTILIENPHLATGYQGFSMTGRLVVDANSLGLNGVKIHGLQDSNGIKATIEGVHVANSTAQGWNLLGESGFGIYGIRMSDCGAFNCGDHAFTLQSKLPTTDVFVAAILLQNCKGESCYGGIYLDYASATLVNPWMESNVGIGIDCFHTQNVIVVGGHMESNRSGGTFVAGVPTGGTDISINGAGASTHGVQVLGTRCTGTVPGFTGPQGNVLLPCFGAAVGSAYSNTGMQIGGTAAADDGTAGFVGEYLTASAANSAVSLSSGVSANLVSLALTAGDWDVAVSGQLSQSLSTVSYGSLSLSTTTATQDTSINRYTRIVPPSGVNVIPLVPIARTRITVGNGTTTTVYAVGNCTFTGGTVTGGAVIEARRPR